MFHRCSILFQRTENSETTESDFWNLSEWLFWTRYLGSGLDFCGSWNCGTQVWNFCNEQNLGLIDHSWVSTVTLKLFWIQNGFRSWGSDTKSMEKFESSNDLTGPQRKCFFCPSEGVIKKRIRSHRRCFCKKPICKDHAFSICKLCFGMAKMNPDFKLEGEPLRFTKGSTHGRICKYSDCKRKTRKNCAFCQQNFCADHLGFICSLCSGQCTD